MGAERGLFQSVCMYKRTCAFVCVCTSNQLSQNTSSPTKVTVTGHLGTEGTLETQRTNKESSMTPWPWVSISWSLPTLTLEFLRQLRGWNYQSKHCVFASPPGGKMSTPEMHGIQVWQAQGLSQDAPAPLPTPTSRSISGAGGLN